MRTCKTTHASARRLYIFAWLSLFVAARILRKAMDRAANDGGDALRMIVIAGLLYDRSKCD